MNYQRTDLGLKLVVGGLLMVFAIFILSYFALLLAALLVGSGLLVCLTGARSQARWAIFLSLSLLALSIGATTLAGYQSGIPAELERSTTTQTLSFFLFAASVAGFLVYADALCRDIKTFALRPAFWILGADVLALVLLGTGALFQVVSWSHLETFSSYSVLPFYAVLIGSLVLLERDISKKGSALARPSEAASDVL